MLNLRHDFIEFLWLQNAVFQTSIGTTFFYFTSFPKHIPEHVNTLPDNLRHVPMYSGVPALKYGPLSFQKVFQLYQRIIDYLLGTEHAQTFERLLKLVQVFAVVVVCEQFLAIPLRNLDCFLS